MAKPLETVSARKSSTPNASFLCNTRLGIVDGDITHREKLTPRDEILSADILLCCRCLRESRNPITPAEYEVASQVVTGLPYKEVARIRKVSSETVKTQINRVFAKTGTSNRSELLMLVLETNIRKLKSTCTINYKNNPQRTTGTGITSREYCGKP